MILAETWPSCLYLITWFVSVLLKITLKGLLVHWKCLWSMFVIWFLDIARKSRNFHAFTQAYLAHAQTNFPAALSAGILYKICNSLWRAKDKPALTIWPQSRSQSPRSSAGGIVGLWENPEENQPFIGCLIISLTHSLLIEICAILIIQKA